jgi:nucleotide-binding universal stress UspA family protein
MQLSKILVPLDGSPLAEMILPRATELAGSTSAKVVLLRAVEARSFPGVDPTEAQIKVVKEGEEYLGQVADRLQAAGVKDVEVSVWYGPPAYAIVEAARLYKADLIAMTTHGRSGLGRMILGSVAESVLRGTTTPILLVRAAEAPVEPPAGKGEPVKGKGGGR